jgi:hypothetical protein
MKLCKCGGEIAKRYNSTIQNKLCPKCTLLEAMKKAPKSTETGKFKTIYSKTGICSSNKKKSSKSRISKNMDLADLWFSRYIRVKYSLPYLAQIVCRDIVTGKPYAAERIDNGHYHSRANMATRYEENNCRPQNRSSNRFQGEADKFKFQENLIKEIGQEEFDRIEKLARNSSFKFGETELKEIADKYRKLTNELLKQKGAVAWWTAKKGKYISEDNDY